MNEWSESVWVALSLIVMSVIIMFSLNTMKLGKEIMGTLNEQQNKTELIKEFRLYNAYNHKTVYCQDVVSLILETRGTPYIEVNTGTEILYWQESSAIANVKGIPVQHATEYSSTSILEKLDINKVYDAELITGDNGEVLGICLIARTV